MDKVTGIGEHVDIAGESRAGVRLTWRYYLRLPITRVAVLVAGLSLGSAVFRWATGRGGPDDLARYHDRTFPVACVVDGDTFDIAIADGERPRTRVRLWGVDAPELAHASQGAPEPAGSDPATLLGHESKETPEPGHGSKGLTARGDGSREALTLDPAAPGAMVFGPEAAALTRRRLAGGAVRLVLNPRQTRDRYGRVLAYVYVGDNPVSLNETLIADGCAYADRRFDHPYGARFEALEKHAQKTNTGLWAEIRPDQMPPWRQAMTAGR